MFHRHASICSTSHVTGKGLCLADSSLQKEVHVQHPGVGRGLGDLLGVGGWSGAAIPFIKLYVKLLFVLKGLLTLSALLCSDLLQGLHGALGVRLCS